MLMALRKSLESLAAKTLSEVRARLVLEEDDQVWQEGKEVEGVMLKLHDVVLEVCVVQVLQMALEMHAAYLYYCLSRSREHPSPYA